MFLLNYPSLRTCSAGIGFSTQRVGFFHDEIESPERVTISVIILSESLLTSRIIAHSVKNSIEFLSQNGVFMVFVDGISGQKCAPKNGISGQKRTPKNRISGQKCTPKNGISGFFLGGILNLL